jgi:hypothetical protein
MAACAGSKGARRAARMHYGVGVGGEHHQILDSLEVVTAAESTIATQLDAITGQVANAKDEASYAGTAVRLRVGHRRL